MILNLQQWGDVFSLGQLLVALILVQFAIFEFIKASDEFEKSQTTPDMDLYWESSCIADRQHWAVIKLWTETHQEAKTF